MSPGRKAFVYFFGVFAPFFTLFFESSFHICSFTPANPLPTIWHGFVIAFVPLSIWLVARRVDRPDYKPDIQDLLILCCSMAISTYYSILMFPLLPAAAIGIFFCGIGLLAFAPAASLLAAALVCDCVVRDSRLSAGWLQRLTSIWFLGGACAFVCCVAGLLWANCKY